MDFLCLSKEIFEKYELSPAEIGALIAILFHQKRTDTDTYTVSLSEVARRLKISRNTISKYLELLEKSGIVRVKMTKDSRLVLRYTKKVTSTKCFVYYPFTFFNKIRYLTLWQQGIAAWLLYYRNTKTNETYVSYDTLRVFSGGSRRRIISTVTKLSTIGAISIAYNATKRVIMFNFSDTPCSIQSLPLLNPVTQNTATLLNSVTLPAQFSHHNNIFNNKYLTILSNKRQCEQLMLTIDYLLYGIYQPFKS